MVDSDPVAKGESKGSYGSSVKCPVCGSVFGGNADLEGVQWGRDEGVARDIREESVKFLPCRET